MTEICPFYDGGSQCRQDYGPTKKCNGDPLACPKVGYAVRRPKVIIDDAEYLDALFAEVGRSNEDAAIQVALLQKCLEWVLKRGHISAPSRWFG